MQTGDDEEIPLSEGMGETADSLSSIDPARLPNRQIRRQFNKLKKKPHFKRTLHQTQQEAQTKMAPQDAPSEDAQAELLKHVDVQAFLGVLNALLTGQKKLVIESVAKHNKSLYDPTVLTGLVDYVHTFKVEDCA